ncbi:Rossmann-fold NAD(P)-binding domain-containing protein [Pararcticibacter amylolyticus]|uniref:Lactate dehydrogenase n=1 Tax=Pararcticibacter amylolyticus TaxID=2173175 RepID=A0A2U2PCE4_9SPHI|nr:lactate dehydrogenase [Pararcticibacter amylolyticus]PWG79023.1 lactate dehydrogenase [Pararcticibacter amylolyticus]
MRAVAYSIRSFEKEPLAKANHKKHDITLISNALGLETAEYAAGKEAVIISGDDYVSDAIVSRLADLGVKFITVRSIESSNVDRIAASRFNIKIATVAVPANVPVTGPEFILHQYEIASGTISNLDLWQENKNLMADPVLSTAASNIISTKMTNSPDAG